MQSGTDVLFVIEAREHHQRWRVHEQPVGGLWVRWEQPFMSHETAIRAIEDVRDKFQAMHWSKRGEGLWLGLRGMVTDEARPDQLVDRAKLEALLARREGGS